MCNQIHDIYTKTSAIVSQSGISSDSIDLSAVLHSVSYSGKICDPCSATVCQSGRQTYSLTDSIYLLYHHRPWSTAPSTPATSASRRLPRPQVLQQAKLSRSRSGHATHGPDLRWHALLRSCIPPTTGHSDCKQPADCMPYEALPHIAACIAACQLTLQQGIHTFVLIASIDCSLIRMSHSHTRTHILGNLQGQLGNFAIGIIDKWHMQTAS